MNTNNQLPFRPPVVFAPPMPPEAVPTRSLPMPSAAEVVLRTQVAPVEVIVGSPESAQESGESLGTQVRKTIEGYLNEVLIKKHTSVLDEITSLLDAYDTENSDDKLPALVKDEIKKTEESIYADTANVIKDLVPVVHQECDEPVARRVDQKISDGSVSPNTASRVQVIHQLAAQRLDTIVGSTREVMSEEIGVVVSNNTANPKTDPELSKELAEGKQKALRILFGDQEGEQDGLHRRLDSLERLHVNSGMHKTGRVVIGMRSGSEEAGSKLDAKVEAVLKDILEYVNRQKTRLPGFRSSILIGWLEDNRNGGIDEKTAQQQVQAIVSGFRERVQKKAFNDDSLDLFANIEVLPLLTNKYPNLVPAKDSVKTESMVLGQRDDPSRLLTEAVAEEDRPNIALLIFKYVTNGGDTNALAVLLSALSAISDEKIRATTIEQALRLPSNGQ